MFNLEVVKSTKLKKTSKLLYFI